MYILSINIWFQKLMKQFFFGIDSVIYNFISSIYDLLISIARTSVLSQADILEMADKIYKLLAVFMIFKVTFSLITYVVNPDDFSDKNKGISKLITNIITSLGLLILTPYIFNMAYRLQTIILEDNTLATLIFETEKEQAGGTAGDFINSAGDEIAFMTMRPFFTPNTSIKQLERCIDLTDINGKFNPICSGIDNKTFEKCNSAGECGVEVEENFDASNTMAAIIDEKLVQNYVVGINNKNLGLMFRQDLAVAVTVVNENDEFVMEYKYVFSTVVGVVVVLLLIMYCMDVALRSIKLSFLQLIAPIPILSYIDPKSGKDGLFKKWYQLCFKTYLSLFIRLLALYFAVYIIDKVADMQLVDIIDGSQQTNFLISIFIIIGALMFAKDLPKILEGLGIKLDGGGKFTLNPIKKFTEQAAGGKKILGAGKGLAAGAMVGTAGALTGAGIGRGVSATLGGLKAGLQGKKFGEITKDQATKNAEMRRAIASGSTFLGRSHAQLSGYFGTPGSLGNIEHDKIQTQNRIDDLNAQKKEIDNRNAPIRRQIQEKTDLSSTLKAIQDRGVSKVKQGVGAQGKYYKEMLQDAAALDAQSQHETNPQRASELARQAEEKRQRAETYANTEGRDNWINENMEKDVELKNLRVTYDQQTKTAGTINVFTTPEYYYDEKGDVILDENGEPLSKSIAENIDTQGKNLSTDIAVSRASIASSEKEIKTLDEKIKEQQEEIERLNAEEKVAKSNVEVTHSTQGGPAHPGSIKRAESTVGRRNGGPGSGMGPMGPMGPGGGPRGR